MLLVSHGPEGSLGFALDRPSPYSVAESFEALGVEARPGKDPRPVLHGGPAHRHTGWLLFDPRRAGPVEGAAAPLAPGLAVTACPEAAAEVAGRPGAPWLLILGYASWGPGQLEEELAAGGWLCGEPDPRLVFDVPALERRAAALFALGLPPDFTGDAPFADA